MLFNRIDDLAKKRARLHVVVGILKDRTNNLAARGYSRRCGQTLEGREQFVVDEFDKLIAGT